MDNWGDPWSDNADTITPAPKNAVTSAPPTTFDPAPALLNGFLDDAGWGNDEDSFGDWATSTGKDAEHATPVKTRATEAFTPEDRPGTSRRSLWDTKERDIEYVKHGESDWAASKSDGTEHHGHVRSETSDSSTTIPAIETTAFTESDVEVHPRPDYDSSARPSTSPSERSHNEIHIDSPRTSYEEEQGAEKISGTETGHKQSIAVRDRSDLEKATQKLEQSSSRDADDSNSLGITFEPSDLEHDTLAANHMTDVPVADLRPSDAVGQELPTRQTADDTTVSDRRIHYAIDQVLLDALNLSAKETQKLEEAPDDPVYSTSGRKAWYRLTRKQTLREYNSGNADDNYIRVTWANSNVRSEVNNTVGRWAREDRISGTGPGARASFYWDSPVPTEANIASRNARQKSSVMIPDEPAPARQSLPPLSTHISPAFNWSSPSMADDPWQQSGPRARSTSSPMVSSHPAIRRVLAQEGGTVPLKSTPPKAEPSIPEQPAPLSPPAERPPATVSSIADPATSAIATSGDPWADLSSLVTFIAPMEQNVGVPITGEDDDEWGDMVSSPTISIPSADESMSQATTRGDTFSTLVSTPQSADTPSMHDQMSDPTPASGIVRLKSTISPTSALFKTNTFVPMDPELGLIGPGILKPIDRSASARFMDKIDTSVSASSKNTLQTGVRDEIVSSARADILASWDPTATSSDGRPTHNLTSTSAPSPLKPVTTTSPRTPTSVPADNGSNAWTDADFSMFETARPATPPPPPPAEARYDQGDSYSPLNYSPRSTRGESPARSVTRSRRNTLLPALQMLTGATNFSQRQKVDEDEIIADILSELPDLSYMLA